ncbi:Phosphatidylglycerol/phosphatidylinositol transfer protein [Coniothyrium glycines]
MSGTSTKTSFFSFGPDDSFVSRSFAGFKYHNLPAPLRNLIIGSTIAEVHWACLGPVNNSWILSYKDSSGKNSLRWGPDIPQRLQSILTKTWHSPHLRAFLGPNDSFIVWHPDLIRWASLPLSLEDVLQSWLTPSGWRVGPPRMVTWGPEGAFFAMSEYGDVVYRLGDGDSWDIFKETVEEWKGEKGFSWSEIAFITLDPVISDQFIAIRGDGSWAGAMDDENEDALETFALNFFARAKPKQKSKPTTSQSNSRLFNDVRSSNPPQQDAAMQALYERWAQETANMFASAASAINGAAPKAPRKLQVRSQSSTSDASSSPTLRRTTSSPARLLTSFPYLPATITICALTACAILKAEQDSMHACQHDVERLLRASGMYSYEWLRQERLRWHPDRFGRLCDEAWRETGKKMAGEMFKLLSVLIEEIRAREGVSG